MLCICFYTWYNHCRPIFYLNVTNRHIFDEEWSFQSHIFSFRFPVDLPRCRRRKSADFTGSGESNWNWSPTHKSIIAKTVFLFSECSRDTCGSGARNANAPLYFSLRFQQTGTFTSIDSENDIGKCHKITQGPIPKCVYKLIIQNS